MSPPYLDARVGHDWPPDDTFNASRMTPVANARSAAQRQGVGSLARRSSVLSHALEHGCCASRRFIAMRRAARNLLRIAPAGTQTMAQMPRDAPLLEASHAPVPGRSTNECCDPRSSRAGFLSARLTGHCHSIPHRAKGTFGYVTIPAETLAHSRPDRHPLVIWADAVPLPARRRSDAPTAVFWLAISRLPRGWSWRRVDHNNGRACWRARRQSPLKLRIRRLSVLRAFRCARQHMSAPAKHKHVIRPRRNA